MEPEHRLRWRRGSPRFSYDESVFPAAFRASDGELPMASRSKKSVSRDLAIPQQPELIGALPREVGVLLVVAGLGGILLPGPIGSPFLLLGGVTLWPRMFARLEASFQRRFPKIHRQGSRQIKRFLADL